MHEPRPVTGLYQHVLLVVDLTDDSTVIGARARAVAAACGARVTLVHVV